jgi:cell division septation protein DedD
MELTCPRCGAKNGRANTSALAASCSACGGSLAKGGGASRPREYDGYAVGLRVLRLAPAWLLLVVVAFALALLLFSWSGRRAGAPEEEAFRNEMTNRAPAPDEVARPGVSSAKAPRAAAVAPPAAPSAAPTATTPATPGPAVEGAGDEAEAYSVQVGAFADLSQANEQVSRLRAAGFDARVVESGAATRFRFQVRSGRYAAREEAAALGARLRAAGVAGDTVIVEPGKK